MKKLNNLRLLRAQAKECSLETLEEIVEKLDSIIKERKIEEEMQFQQYLEKRAKIDRYIEMLEKEGISVNELTNEAPKGKIRLSAKDKYQFVNENGETKKWSGVGRMPKALKWKIAKGHKLEEFVI